MCWRTLSTVFSNFHRYILVVFIIFIVLFFKVISIGFIVSYLYKADGGFVKDRSKVLVQRPVFSRVGPVFRSAAKRAVTGAKFQLSNLVSQQTWRIERTSWSRSWSFAIPLHHSGRILVGY